MKQPADSRQKILADFEALLDRAIAIGQAKVRRDLMSLIQGDEGPNPKSNGQEGGDGGRDLAFGMITNALRIVMDAHGRSALGIDIKTMVSRAKKPPVSMTFSPRQLRSALKGLLKGKEIERASRGKYRATSKLSLPPPAEVAPVLPYGSQL